MRDKLANLQSIDFYKMDMHIHSESSNCSSRPICDIINECANTKLEILGIVDHYHNDNLQSLLNRKKIGIHCNKNIKLDIFYGIEIDFYKKNQQNYDKEMLDEFDLVLGANHWLNDFHVNFFPETKPENKIKGLKPIELRSEVIRDIEACDRETFFDLFIGTIHTMLYCNSIDVWAHPFRTLGFLLIHNKNYLNYFIEQYLNGIVADLSNQNIIFELNEGLNNSLHYRGGKYFTEDLQNDWNRFYSKVIELLKLNDIPIIYGTDSHNSSVKIGGYNWVKNMLL